MRIVFTRMTKLAGSLLACLLGLSATGAALAQPVAEAGVHRPAGVPAGYLVTPFGYFHPSCVVRLQAGDELRPGRQMITHADSTVSPMHVCSYPHYRADGEMVSGDERAATTPDISHAYVEYATVTTTRSWSYLDARWTVPPAPTSLDGQTVFFFPGLEDIDNVVTIIQPVLGFNDDFTNAWGIASWNCCVSGTTYEAPPQHVTPGDTILGYMFNSCPPGTLTCSSWDIVTTDLRTGKSSELLDTSNFTQTFNWAFGAAMEVYAISQCSDYPAVSGEPGSDGVGFTSIDLYDQDQHRVANPAWSVAIDKTDTPQCNYSGTQPRQITLHY